MRYLSTFSGIEAATVAWHPLGWQPVAFAEVEPFPCAVLTHHYPDIPNLGDVTAYKTWPDYGDTIDILVGGSPCQSFSIAGLRRGLTDPRGNLMLTYLAIAGRYRPRWLVWENVPGVLSSKKGRDFAAFINGLAELGYHAAWRVLDAQYVRVDGFGRAVPQRRRRVFVVGYLGDWTRAAAVLFDAESLCGDTPPRRRQGQGYAPHLENRTHGGGGLGTDGDLDGGLIAMSTGQSGAEICTDGQGPTLTCNHEAPIVAHALRAQAQSAHASDLETYIPAFAIQERAVSESPTSGPNGKGFQPDLAYTLEARNKVQAIAFSGRSRGDDGRGYERAPHVTGDVACTVDTVKPPCIAFPAEMSGTQWAVRRVTPRECERLQGFPDDYTRIPWRGKPAEECPNGHRYKAIGNSMPVNAMCWLGRRIERVEDHIQ